MNQIKQVAKGFAGRIVPKKKKNKEDLFQGSTSTAARREALLRCMQPDLGGVPIAFQRTEEEEVCA
jgi:hypothetical protein